jgi:hypothetical protein
MSPQRRLVPYFLIFLSMVFLVDLWLSPAAPVGEDDEGKHATIRMEDDESVIYQPPFPGAPTIVFTVGLEGTGHHFIDALAKKKSPGLAAKRTVKGLLKPPLAEIIKLCYHEQDDGLLPADGNRSLVGTKNNPSLSTLRQKVVDQLRGISERYHNHNHSNSQPTYIVFNEFSYPNYIWCHRQAYPDVDLFLAACTEAQVNGGLVYLYRDPYAIVHSNIRRKFDRDAGTAIAMYRTMLTALEAQLTRNPRAILACIGLLDETQPEEERWDPLGKFLGHHDPAAFRQVVHSTMKSGKEVLMSDVQKQQLVGIDDRPAMHKLVEQHQRVLRICHEQVLRLPP